MANALLDKVSGMNFKGGQIPAGKYEARYNRMGSYGLGDSYSDSDCVDCGDCDCSDCPVGDCDCDCISDCE